MAEILVKEITKAEAEQLGVDQWGIWTCEPSTFDWEYPEQEIAYILEGEVVVHANDKETHLKPGMLVTFPAGMQCVWEVRQPFKKAYTFDTSLG